MASLNTSVNGPSIRSSYQGVINGSAATSASPTHAQWALFTVQAPLMNAFQNSGAKESVLRVQSTGEGELADLAEDFDEGRIQYAFVRVKDPNTSLLKFVFIAWCGGSVPERTKGFFTSHTAAVTKILHGYHVQISARSDTDLVAERILQKVADASGAKYTAGGAAPLASSGAPRLDVKKPVFSPIATSAVGSLKRIDAARGRRQGKMDDDWGVDAPPVTRTQLEKVESAYKPTKVNMAELMRAKDDSRSNGVGVVGGGYQPVGKVDIAAIRAQTQNKQDDRPTIVKGAYEPVGKVDIAAIRAKAQRPAEETEEKAALPKSVADRSAAFAQSERLIELPKPKLGKKFGGSTFTGTKAPAPDGFCAPSVPAAAPVGCASRTFADQGGKTPAQLWAEKKAKQGGSTISPPMTSPILAQRSGTPLAAQKSGGEWKSNYAGKSWAPVQTTNFGRGGVERQGIGAADACDTERQAPVSPIGGVSALRDQFKNAAPMGGAVPALRSIPEPPPLPTATRPSGGFALPGLPSRPAVGNQEEKEDDQEPASPVRVALLAVRGPESKLEPPAERLPPCPVPAPEEIPTHKELPSEDETYDLRVAAVAVAEQSVGHVADCQPAFGGGKRALIQYDYEKAEDNEIELREGEYVTNIEMIDEDWWMGTNADGQSGLFPSNYVELVQDGEASAHVAAAVLPPPPLTPESEPVAACVPAPAVGGKTATAQFDYEAAEDNELTFPDGAKITGLEFPDEDWWFGHYNGASGLFPANYVQLDS